MGMISAYYKIESVLIAVGITAFVCLGVTLFSFQTKYDFTSCGGILLVISLALFGFGIIAIFTYSRVRIEQIKFNQDFSNFFRFYIQSMLDLERWLFQL
jgi:FtsH-binding integral membrane protein